MSVTTAELADTPIDVEAIFRKDNTVMPISFWTPDEVNIPIKPLLKTKCSTFKDKGTGDRYKIKTGGQISYLFRIGDLWYWGYPNDDMRIPGIHIRYTGKYYGDRKVIDDRYNNPFKVSIDVAAIFYAIGEVSPYAFWWEDGTEYSIDRVIAVEKQTVSLKAGILGTKYTVKVTAGEISRVTALFRDDDLWFMERRDKNCAPVLDVHGRPIKKSAEEFDISAIWRK